MKTLAVAFSEGSGSHLVVARPLCIDLFCGLGGWTEGFLAEGYDVVGFDIERHIYGAQRYPAQLVLQDVLTLDGRQFRNAAVIVASPPCQEYSYMAMPWKLAKAKAAWYREDVTRQLELNCLLNACFRIAHEAGVPLVVENVKGAQPWIGRAKWHYGSFYLWGDVPALMPSTQHAEAIKNDGGSWFAAPGQTNTGQNPDGRTVPEYSDPRRNGGKGAHLTSPRENEQCKVSGLNWSDYGTPGYKPKGFNVTAAQRFSEENGTKQNGSGPVWFDTGIAKHSSRSDSRKAASAQIAKIPRPLAEWIAKSFKPWKHRNDREHMNNKARQGVAPGGPLSPTAKRILQFLKDNPDVAHAAGLEVRQ